MLRQLSCLLTVVQLRVVATLHGVDVGCGDRSSSPADIASAMRGRTMVDGQVSPAWWQCAFASEARCIAAKHSSSVWLPCLAAHAD